MKRSLWSSLKAVCPGFQSSCVMKALSLALFCLFTFSLSAAFAQQARTIRFDENLGKGGFAVGAMSASHVDVTFRLEQVKVEDLAVGGNVMQQISIPGVILPNDEGAPNLPGLGRHVAVPRGAVAGLQIMAKKTEVITDLDVLPAPAIPLDTDDSPPVYVKDPAIYSADAYYPADPVRLSERRRMRGVDVAVLGITPFQYNPVKRELVVYTEVSVRVSFAGGTGRFGQDRLRSRYWEPILAENLINYDSLPEIGQETTYYAVDSTDAEYEYVIIVPDDPIYIAQADRLRQWRTLQGIDTGVVTLTETGTTAAAIESWINNAYSTWSTPPVAILLLADYVVSGGSTGITSPFYNNYCVSDNIYGDVDGDHLPDIVMARMTATPANIETLVTKAIDYERFPVTDSGFYQNPVVACGWQTDRWFTICTEIVYGYWANVLGKTPVREYAIYLGTPGDIWSTNMNTDMLVDYFGPDGLGYIPLTPEHLTDWGGSAQRLNADINSGAFIVQHRDHGSLSGWGEPAYGISSLSGLTNEYLTFVFSINCLTGKYDYSSEVFAEAFHRMNYGALGLIAATEVSYSFVNDTFVFGIYDSMWPDFDPGYGTPGPPSLRPGFAQASGKYYLQASNWPYNTSDKQVTYHLFHMHGDAFTTLYSEVPKDLTVTHPEALPMGATSFSVTADQDSVIALTVDGQIIGVADGTGQAVDVPVVAQTVPGMMRVTVTKQDHFRYSAEVAVVEPVIYQIHPATVPVNTPTEVVVTVWDNEGAPLSDVIVTIDGWGTDPVTGTTDSNGEAHLLVTPLYGEDLSVVGRQIGETYDCLQTVLPVTGGQTFASADIDASVAEIGLYGSLIPFIEGTITGTASESGFSLYAVGCGVDASVNSGGEQTVDLPATPTSGGTIRAALGKNGFDLYLEDIAVEVVYGTLAGTVFDNDSLPLADVVIKGFPEGTNPAGATPVFETTSGPDGAYSVEQDLEAGYYDVYLEKFAYLQAMETVIVRNETNVVDFTLYPAPSGVVSGTVTEAGTGTALEATIRVYRDDTMELYAEIQSSESTGGAYEVTLPYFDYIFKVWSAKHAVESVEVLVDKPADVVDFVLVPTIANVLVVNDGGGSEITSDLAGFGCTVIQKGAPSSEPDTWRFYDFIVWSCGKDSSPVSTESYRDALESHVAGGGKLLIEGGEIGYDAAYSPGYPTFATNVLHIQSWNHDASGDITIYEATHPLASSPNQIETMTFIDPDWDDQDANTAALDATMVSNWSNYADHSSVLAYDDDPATVDDGQIVYYSFNYEAVEDPVKRAALLENSLVYFVGASAIPATGSIAGTATLDGQSDHSGIKVTATPNGAYAYTDGSGAYVIENLADGTYTIEATMKGWVPAVAEGIVLQNGGQAVAPDVTLYPRKKGGRG